MKRKLLLSIVGICGLLFTVISCDKEKMRIPEPEVNPVVLTSDAQSKEIWVKYLLRLDAPSRYISSELNDIGNVVVQKLTYEDWLTVTYNVPQGNKENQKITITVKANETSEPRSFTFELSSYIKGVDFTVTQEGKK